MRKGQQGPRSAPGAFALSRQRSSCPGTPPAVHGRSGGQAKQLVQLTYAAKRVEGWVHASPRGSSPCGLLHSRVPQRTHTTSPPAHSGAAAYQACAQGQEGTRAAAPTSGSPESPATPPRRRSHRSTPQPGDAGGVNTRLIMPRPHIPPATVGTRACQSTVTDRSSTRPGCA